MKFILALHMAKLTRLAIKIVGLFSNINGSHFPGNVALKLDKDFLRDVGKPKTIITVTGTNGKTTTCNLIIDLLEKAGYKVLNNKFGSNVRGGITTALLSGVSIFNKPKYDIAVLEVDERSSEYIYPYIKPTYSVITNLFRDSLKRNAHSEFIFNLINDALANETTLILNADDLISNRAKEKTNERVFFGIEKQENDGKESVNIVNDARICPICNEKLDYDFVRYHHIGRAYCKKCGYKSPKADYMIKSINYDKQEIEVIDNKNKVTEKYKMISDSIFNLYNEIAAITLLKELKVPYETIKEGFDSIKITEARYKKEEINGVNIINHLAKGQNPVACSIIFKYLKEEKNEKELVLLMEDYHDNRESSENIAWLYDCDFEFLNDENIKKIVVGGIRADDFKYRLQLAGVDEDKIVAIANEEEIPNYLSLEQGKDTYILYDMYEQKIVDMVNKKIKEKIKEKSKVSGGGAND